MKRLLSIAVVLVIGAPYASAKEPVFRVDQVQITGLSRNQTKQILMIVLKHEKYRLSMPGIFLDDQLADKKGNPPHPGYYDFSLGFDSVKAGATKYLGLFSVSRMTGDVWEINLCKQYNFPLLRHIQAGIMRRTGKSFAGEKQARRGLGCTNE